jgi:SAM-dependent methyltransferase
VTPPESPGLSFGTAADRYDDLRPSYPPAALTWALGTAPARVVDLGAGTGKLTRVLLALGHRVVPVEPDAQMRRRLAERSPEVEPLEGTAERIPLPDGSVDAVVAGQAYHWFDPERAHPEIARVLRPGGVFAPVWNIRDESVPWLARLTEIVDGQPGDGHEGQLENADFGPLFGQVTGKIFRHESSMTADRLVALISTRSYYLTATPRRRADIEQGVRELVAAMPEPFPLPYETFVYRARRTPTVTDATQRLRS